MDVASIPESQLSHALENLQVSADLTNCLQGAFLSHQLLDDEHGRRIVLSIEWAGAMRALEKLRVDPTFVGDRWLPELGDSSDAIAEIITKIVREPDQSPTVEVIASVEAGPYLQRVQRTTLFPFRLPTN